MTYLIPAVALIWAGVSLGGNLVAAPAKFAGTDLSTSVLLQVSHAQFLWLGYTEWVLLIGLIIYALVVRHGSALWYLVPVAIFSIQQLVIMPMLNERTLLQIANVEVGSSSLHVVFVILEFLKLVSLIAISLIELNSLNRDVTIA